MKCLTVHQPWASLIVKDIKRIENRNWYPDYRGPMLIHAGRSLKWIAEAEKDSELPYMIGRLRDLPRGMLIGAVNLVEILTPHAAQVKLSNYAHLLQDQYDWIDRTAQWCWLLADALEFETPVAWKGKQGLFEVPNPIDSGEIQLYVTVLNALDPWRTALDKGKAKA